jgi:2-polyprenyl-6-methoxyphenol hydroxylase-like FAD-dependent oxidoreductase
MQQPLRILIVGAGMCGLTTALAIARLGIAVTVLDKRQGGSEPASVAAIDAVASELAALQARAPLDPTALPAALETMRKRLQPVWGRKERNVLIDSATLQYLAALGVNVADFPPMQHIAINSMDGDFVLHLSLGATPLAASAPAIAAEQVILQRDFVVQPTLGDLERRVLATVCAHELIDVHFDHRVLGVHEDSACVTVSTCHGPMTAELVIIADGAAASSVSRRLRHQPPNPRCVIDSEPISIAVLRAQAGEQLHGIDTALAFTWTTFTDDGWRGVFCNGKNLTFAVSDPLPGQNHHSEALRVARSWGCTAPLVEPPFKVHGEVAIARSPVSGQRIVLAGDAAQSGNPRFGLGVQYAVFWARIVADWLAGSTRTVSHPQVRDYERMALATAARRTDYEKAWLDGISAFIRAGGILSDASLISRLASALTHARTRLIPRDDGWQLFCDVSFDFGADDQPGLRGGSPEPRNAMVRTLESLGVVRLRMDVDVIQTDRSKTAIGTVRFSRPKNIEMTIGGQRWRLQSGELEVRREDDHWQMRLVGVRVVQTGVSGRTVPQQPLHIDQLDVRVPDRLVDALLGFDMTLVAGATRARTLDSRISLHPGDEVTWGPLRIRAVRSPVIHLRGPLTNRAGERIFQASIEHGALILLNLSELAANSRIGPLAALNAFNHVTGNRWRSWIDRAMSAAGVMVQAATLAFHPDDRVFMTFHGALPFTVALSALDIARLQGNMVNSAALADMLFAANGKPPSSIQRSFE